MGNLFKPTTFKIYLILCRIYGQLILKCKFRHVSAVFFKAYIQTFVLFPENKLKINSAIALVVRSRIFELPKPELKEEIDENQVQSLYDLMIHEDWVRKTISKYYLIEAFYYSYALTSELLKEKSVQSYEKSKLYDSTANLIGYDDIGSMNKEIKTDLKILQKEMRKLNAEKIESEKLKIIRPISITSTHIMFVLSLFSTLFVISGFIYNKLFFNSFGISVGDFFSISDYLASSVDVIMATVISSALGLAFYFWGLSSALSEELRAEQFETDSKKEDYVIPIIVSTSSIGLVAHSYHTGELHSLFLYVLTFFILMHVFYRLPIWKYIENRAPVGAALLSIIYFSLHLGISIKDEVQSIKSGSYKSSYKIQYKVPYPSREDNEFIASNSGYVFVWDSKREHMNIISKAEVLGFRAK